MIYAMAIIVMCCAIIAYGSSFLVEAIFIFLKKYRDIDKHEAECDTDHLTVEAFKNVAEMLLQSCYYPTITRYKIKQANAVKVLVVKQNA